MATRRHYRRRFLNRPGFHAGAYVIAEVRVYRRADHRTKPSIEASLSIADCSRVADLDFCAYDPADVRNALHKARLLRDTVVEFVEAYEAAVEEWRSLQE